MALISRRTIAWVVLSLAGLLVALHLVRASLSPSLKTKDSKRFSRIMDEAELGDPEAQYQLATCYMDGVLVARDKTKARKLIFEAAKQGSTNALKTLGIAYDGENNGLRWKSDLELNIDASEAFKWWKAAADQGDALAQAETGRRYANGEGISKDEIEAFAYSILYQSNPNPPARIVVGANDYWTRTIEERMPSDAILIGWQRALELKKAIDATIKAKLASELARVVAARSNPGYVKRFEKDSTLAMLGDASSQYNLGLSYKLGRGVDKDYLEAYAFYNLAAVSDEAAREELLELERDLSNADRLLGQQRTKDLQKEIEFRKAAKNSGK
jgi:TPR repeat protein